MASSYANIIKSQPSGRLLIDFLGSHKKDLRKYILWGGSLALEKYELYGLEFDAYATYANHGCRLTLVKFTEAWINPFESDDMAERNPKIVSEIQQALINIRSLQQRYKNDIETQARLRKELGYQRILETTGVTSIVSIPYSRATLRPAQRGARPSLVCKL